MDKRIYPHPIFAKEGWPFMAGTGVLALLATAMGWGFLSVIFWALFILVVQKFPRARSLCFPSLAARF